MRKSIVLLSLVLMFTITSHASSFKDTTKHWARESIAKLVEKNITTGYPDGTFKPNNNISILEYIAFVERAMNEAPSKWGKPYIEKAVALGLIKVNQFKDVNKAITREEMAYIITNALEWITKKEITIEDQTRGEIDDIKSLSDQYKEQVLKAYQVGLIKGYPDGNFYPKKTATRAESTVVIIRLLDQVDEPQKPTKPTGEHPLTKELLTAKKSDFKHLLSNNTYDTFDFVDGKVLINSYYPKSSLNYHKTRFIDDTNLPNVNEIIYAFIKNSDPERFQAIKLIERKNPSENVLLLTYAYNQGFYENNAYYYSFSFTENYIYDAKDDWIIDHFSEKVNMALHVRRVNEVDGSTKGQVEKDIADRLVATLKDMFPDQGKSLADYVMNKVLVYQEKPETKMFGNIQIDYIYDGGQNFFITFLDK